MSNLNRINKKRKIIRFTTKTAKKIKNEPNSDDNIEEDEIITPAGVLDLLKARDTDMIYRQNNNIYFRADVTLRTINKLGRLIDEANLEFDLIAKSCYQGEITPKPIYLRLTSDGGSIFSGLQAVDMIKNSKIPIYTVIEGSVASAGSFMSIVGKKRFMSENSYILIHQLSSTESGSFHQLTDSYKNNKNLMKHIKKLYIEHTNINRKDLDKVLAHDIFWNFATAKKYGFVDEMYKPDIIYETTEK